MARSKKPSSSDPRWAPVPDAVLDHFAPPDAPANHRNGTTPKTVLTDDGTVPLRSRAIGPARSSRC